MLSSWAWGQTKQDCIRSKANPNVYYRVDESSLEHWPPSIKGEVPLPPMGCFVKHEEWKLRPGECYPVLHDGVIIFPFEPGRGDGWQDVPSCFYVMLEPPKPEPIDVPAIQTFDGTSFVVLCAKGQKPTIPSMKGYCLTPRNTCADKSRILQHDEQSPPKYWCHKPQL
jgi:hypothetical protein